MTQHNKKRTRLPKLLPLIMLAVGIMLSSVLASPQAGGEGLLGRPLEMLGGLQSNVFDYIALGTVIAAIVSELFHLIGGSGPRFESKKQGPTILAITAAVIIFSDALFGQSFVQMINNGAIRSTIYLFMLLYVVLVVTTRNTIEGNMLGKDSVLPTSRLVLVYSVVSATNGMFMSVQQGTEILTAFLFHLITAFIGLQLISRMKLKKAKEKEEQDYKGLFSDSNEKQSHSKKESKEIQELKERLESMESHHQDEEQRLQDELKQLKEQNKTIQQQKHHIDDSTQNLESAAATNDTEKYESEIDQLEQYFSQTHDDLSSVVTDHTKRLTDDKKSIYQSNNLQPLFEERIAEEQKSIQSLIDEYQTITDETSLKQQTTIGKLLSLLQQIYHEYEQFMNGKISENTSFHNLKKNGFKDVLRPLTYVVQQTDDPDFKTVVQKLKRLIQQDPVDEKAFYSLIHDTIELIHSKIRIYTQTLQEDIQQQKKEYEKHKQFASSAQQEIKELQELENKEISLQEQIIQLGNSLRVVSERLAKLRASHDVSSLDEQSMKQLTEYINQYANEIGKLGSLQEELQETMKQEHEKQSNIIPFYKGLRIKESDIKHLTPDGDKHAS
jgi:hypothetical protein